MVFAKVTQDGDTDGCMLMGRLPTTAEADVIRRAEKLIEGCEHCDYADAIVMVPFDWVLDKVTGRRGRRRTIS